MKGVSLFIFILFNSILFSQGELSGKVIESESKEGIHNARVLLIAPIFEFETFTDENGVYTFKNLPNGSYTISLAQDGYYEASTFVDYVKGEAVSVEDLVGEIAASTQSNNDVPIVEAEDIESGNGSNGTSFNSLLNSSRDIFAFNASMSWFVGRFNFRGKRTFNQKFMVNNIPFENVMWNNFTTFSDFTGLNDAMRSRNTYYGIKAVPFDFGATGNTVNIDMSAIKQRRGFRLTQVFTNASYFSRTSLSYHTGLMKNGFAFSGLGSFRGATEAYVPGTASEVFSGYFSASKKFSEKFNTSLTAIAVQNQRASSRSGIKEQYELAGTNYYNPNWGYYKGKKRSSSVRTDFAPVGIFSLEYKPREATKINLSASYQTGTRKRSRLDWYNSYSPLPSYYRNLPSFYKDNPDEYSTVYNNIKENPNLLQVDWDRLYNTNENYIDSVPVKGETGKWARYIMENQVEKLSNIDVNVVAKHQLQENIMLTGGVTAQLYSSEFYREVDDLLGADFYVNVNQFAQLANPDNPDAIHNNLNNPYEIVRKGDKYGYDYKVHVNNLTGWAQSIFTLDQLDFFTALQLRTTTFQREGLYKNGAFPDNSEGNSDAKTLFQLSGKAGATYKLDGKNYFSLAVNHLQNAPNPNVVFPRIRTTNDIFTNLEPMTTIGGEISYNHRSSRMKANLTLFYNQSSSETETINFFTELTNSFGAIVLYNMDKSYKGLEGAVEYKIGNSGFTVNAVSNIGDYVYANRPDQVFFYDNADISNEPKTTYFKNLHLSTGPQIANTLKLTYFAKKYWIASVALNHFDKIYVNPSPQRRTIDAVDNLDPNSDLYSQILTQERLPSAFTLNLFFRKSFLLNKYFKFMEKRMFFDVNFAVNNVLDNQNFINSGTEQLRFDFRGRDPEKFPNRYYYSFGRTFMLNMVYRF